MRERCRSLLIRVLLLSGFALLPATAGALQPDLSDLPSLPRHTAPAAVVAKALQSVDTKSRPLRFAVQAALPLKLADGVWDEPEPGLSRWRTRIASTGALGLALNFNRVQLPQGAQLWLYDEAGRLVQGPYTQADETADGKLWTAIVPGASGVIELRTPTSRRNEVALELGSLSHAFIDISKASEVVAAKSESCNVDVVCPDGDGWRDQIRSVALITINNETLCSGELLNNQRRNRDPLFITANHCEISSSAIAASVVFYWNYQTAVCAGTPSGNLADNQSGATLLAGDVGTDFSLLRLNALPASSFKVYYSGWDASGAAPTSGVAIHHPNGDEKRISTYSRAAAQEEVCIESGVFGCLREVDAWRVNWARGSTAPGSSGGGLWNQNKRLVGTLSGGNASCSAPNADDYFARLSAAFTAGSAKSAQLKAWLDPDNIGTTVIDGLDSSGSTGSNGSDDGGSSSSSSGGGNTSPLLIIVFAFGGLLRWLLAPQRRPSIARRSSGASNSSNKPLPTPAAAINSNKPR